MRPIINIVWPCLAVAWTLSSVLQGCSAGAGIQPAPQSSSPTYGLIIAPASTLTGETAQYQADAPGTLTNIGGENKGTLSFTSGQLSSATIEVSAPSVSLTFNETFTTFSAQSLPGLPGLNVYSAEKTVGGTVRSLLLLDPTSAGLSYSTLGAWGYEDPGAPLTSYGGWLAIGIETRGADIPTTGTANYLGGLAGTYADGTAIYGVAATASAAVDFGARNVNLTTTDTQRFGLNPLGSSPASAPNLNITNSTLTYQPGVNRITGTVQSSTMSGTADARFFGPAGAELGGAFFMKDDANTEQMSGGFVLKKR